MISGYETCLNLLLGWVNLQLTIVIVVTRDEGLKRVRPQFFVCFCCRCARVAPTCRLRDCSVVCALESCPEHHGSEEKKALRSHGWR
jgi:hypothetical protein